MLLDENRINKDVDVLAFVDLSRQDESMSMYIEDACPDLMPILRNVLVSIGETPEKIACLELLYPAFQPFHGEFFAARPAVLRSYLAWLDPVIAILENRTNQRTDTGSDNSTNTSCILSLSHVLASYYFNANMANIVTNKQYTNRLEPDQKIVTHNQFANDFNTGALRNITLKLDTTPIVFILCHSEDTSQKALGTFATFSWANPYIIPSTYFFETFFYSNILGDIIDNLNVTNATWIGSISWKADQKTNIALIDIMLSDQGIKADVLAFWSPDGPNLWLQADYCHLGLMDLMVYVLKSLGERQGHIEMMHLDPPAFKMFYGSYFVTRPSIMRSYIEWISAVIHFINSDRQAQNMVWKDSTYPGDLDAARIVFDLPFYPMHPFLGERLLQYFFNSRGYKIMTSDEYRATKGI